MLSLHSNSLTVHPWYVQCVCGWSHSICCNICKGLWISLQIISLTQLYLILHLTCITILKSVMIIVYAPIHIMSPCIQIMSTVYKWPVYISNIHINHLATWYNVSYCPLSWSSHYTSWSKDFEQLTCIYFRFFQQCYATIAHKFSLLQCFLHARGLIVSYSVYMKVWMAMMSSGMPWEASECIIPHYYCVHIATTSL